MDIPFYGEYGTGYDMRMVFLEYAMMAYLFLFYSFATGTRVVLLWYACGTRIKKMQFFYLFIRRFMFFICL
jgi:hypothetical protein